MIKTETEIEAIFESEIEKCNGWVDDIEYNSYTYKVIWMKQDDDVIPIDIIDVPEFTSAILKTLITQEESKVNGITINVIESDDKVDIDIKNGDNIIIIPFDQIYDHISKLATFYNLFAWKSGKEYYCYISEHIHRMIHEKYCLW